MLPFGFARQYMYVAYITYEDLSLHVAVVRNHVVTLVFK